MSVTFKLKADPTFEAAVPIPIPGSDPKKVKFTFKHRTKDELKEFVTEERSDIDVVMNIAVGWELEPPFTRENVELLLQNYHGAATAISLTYMRELGGARLGN